MVAQLLLTLEVLLFETGQVSRSRRTHVLIFQSKTGMFPSQSSSHLLYFWCPAALDRHFPWVPRWDFSLFYVWLSHLAGCHCSQAKWQGKKRSRLQSRGCQVPWLPWLARLGWLKLRCAGVVLKVVEQLTSPCSLLLSWRRMHLPAEALEMF